MKTKELLLHIICLFIVTIMALALVWIKNEQIKIGYEYSRTFSSFLELEELNEKLHLEWEYLTSYKRLEKIATDEFKMHRPTRKDVIYYMKK